MKLIINKHQFIFGFVSWVFILSEYCSYFYWLDPLHVKHIFYIFVVCIYGCLMMKGSIVIPFEVKQVIKTAFYYI